MWTPFIFWLLTDSSFTSQFVLFMNHSTFTLADWWLISDESKNISDGHNKGFVNIMEATDHCLLSFKFVFNIYNACVWVIIALSNRMKTYIFVPLLNFNQQISLQIYLMLIEWWCKYHHHLLWYALLLQNSGWSTTRSFDSTAADELF